MTVKFQRLVYLAICLMLVVSGIMSVPRPASSSTTTVPLSSLSAGNTVEFDGKTWIVLDPSTGYLLMQDSYGTGKFDSDMGGLIFDPLGENIPYFDPNDTTNIANYLNNDFYNSLNSGALTLIQSHIWNVGKFGLESDHTVDCKIGLISRSEWNNYKSILGNPSSTFWTLTPEGGPGSGMIDYVYTNGDLLLGDYSNMMKGIRPALYLDPENLVSDDSTHTVLIESNLEVLTNSSAGGAVTGGGTYLAGSTVTVQGTPNPGYTFVDWTDGNGITVSTDPSFNYSVTNADTTLVGNFQQSRIIPTIAVVNGIPFSVTVRNTHGLFTGIDNTYGTLTGTASGNDTVITGTLTGVPTTPTAITLGSGTIEIKAVNPPSTTLDSSKSFY